jgi:ABC-2 type transport system ATP-binding protein
MVIDTGSTGTDTDETEAPTIIRVADVSKRFVIRKDNSLKERIVAFGRGRRHREEFWALRNVDLEIEAGNTVALIGHNGSGKSTLLKVIGGIIDATSGTVERRGRVAALLELGAGFHPDLTGRENVFLNASILGLSRAETEARFDEILAFSGIGDFIDTQVKFYSSGMYVRLAFAVAVHTDPDLLLVDEVLAVGDEAFQRKCLDKIRAFQQEGRTIVLVTHSLGQVTELSTRAILLNQGEVVFDGEPREAVAAFRDILEDRRTIEEEKAEAERPEAVAPPRGLVHSTTAHAVGRAAGEPLAPGDTLEIVTEVSYAAGLDEWICGIQIDNALGQVAVGTSSKNVKAKLGPIGADPVKVRLVLHDVRLGSGKYFVNVSVMNMSGQHLVDRPQAASFDVVAPEQSYGILSARPDFETVG